MTTHGTSANRPACRDVLEAKARESLLNELGAGRVEDRPVRLLAARPAAGPTPSGRCGGLRAARADGSRFRIGCVTIRDVLILAGHARVALYRRGNPHTYTELTKQVTAIEWPGGAFTHSGQQIGMLLGQVSLNEFVRDEDRPVLSLIVVGAGDGEMIPTRGCWTFVHSELGIPVRRSEMAELEHWQAEYAAACACYGRGEPVA